MAGTSLRFETNLDKVASNVAQLEHRLQSPQELLDKIGGYLKESTQKRFYAQSAPDGTLWKALQPRYAKRKKYGKNKILTLHGDLRKFISWQPDGPDAVRVGSNLKYARIHQQGGEIKRPAREATQYLRKNARTGKVGRLFVKKTKANHTRQVAIGAYTITMHARPYLGLSEDDRSEISRVTLLWLNGKL